ncbi:hypothetical protein L0222_08880 [bacterium]|nr:hypothetical protein [bacterium]MCI0603694.1 hypothetical protein [bacterium]
MKRNWILFFVTLLLLPAVARSAEDDWMKKAGPKEPLQSMRSSSSRSADAPKPATNVDPFGGVVDVHDFYKVGEVRLVMDFSSYYSAVYPQVKERLAEHRELLKNAKISDATLGKYDQLTAVLLTLPFEKGYDLWPEEAKQKWLNDPSWNNFFNALKDELVNNIYYWLGYHAMNLAWSLPRVMSGDTLSQAALSKLTGAATDYAWIMGEAGFSTFTPEVQTAIKTIGSMKGKSDPDDPFSKALDVKDAEQMKQAAISIRKAVQDKKLVS